MMYIHQPSLARMAQELRAFVGQPPEAAAGAA